MPRKPRLRPVNYNVCALKDGTIVACHTARRPYSRRNHPKPFVDKDGCFGWIEADGSYPGRLPDTQRIILMLSMTQRLNTKKLLHDQVERRLQRMEAKLDALMNSIAPR